MRMPGIPEMSRKTEPAHITADDATQNMAAVDHGEGSYSVEEEIELLEAIYIHELTVEGPRQRPAAVSVLLHPSTGDEEDKRFVCLTLVISLPQKYPYELPSIQIKTPRGLSEAHVDSILSNLRELAETCFGRPMLYELIEYAKESLTDNNVPSCACAICLCHFQDSHEFTKTECYHYFHCGCLARYIEFTLQQQETAEDKTEIECPMCRLPITYNLTELQTVASRELNEDEIAYKPSEEIRKLQKKMASLFDKQKRKGGVIDIEQERNRFLIDITSVRQEEPVPDCEPPTGPETDTVEMNPVAEPSANDVPKRPDIAKETKEPINHVRSDKPVRKGKKEFPKNSRTSRGPRRQLDKTGSKREEESFKRKEQSRMEKTLLTGDERPRSAEKKVREKLNVKESDEQENGFAPCSDDAKQGNSQTELASDKHTSVVGVSEKAARDVFSGSYDSSPTPNSNRERPRSAKRGRGKSGRGRTSGEKKREFQDGGKESNKNTTSSEVAVKKSSKIWSVEGVKPFLQTKSGGDSSKITSSSEEVVKQTSDTRPSESVKTSLQKSGNTQGQTTSVKESPSAKGSSTINKKKRCMPPPGFANVVVDKGGCQKSRNDFRPPPPGFEKRSPRPRPPPGLSKPMEGTEPSASQSIAS